MGIRTKIETAVSTLQKARVETRNKAYMINRMRQYDVVFTSYLNKPRGVASEKKAILDFRSQYNPTLHAIFNNPRISVETVRSVFVPIESLYNSLMSAEI